MDYVNVAIVYFHIIYNSSFNINKTFDATQFSFLWPSLSK